jgi:hypothetical protein
MLMPVLFSYEDDPAARAYDAPVAASQKMLLWKSFPPAVIMMLVASARYASFLTLMA